MKPKHNFPHPFSNDVEKHEKTHHVGRHGKLQQFQVGGVLPCTVSPGIFTIQKAEYEAAKIKTLWTPLSQPSLRAKFLWPAKLWPLAQKKLAIWSRKVFDNEKRSCIRNVSLTMYQICLLCIYTTYICCFVQWEVHDINYIEVL